MVHIFNRIWHPNMDVQVFEIKCLVCMTYNFFIGFYNLLNVNIDEIVVGINVLFHKTFGFKKSWDKLPFFLHAYKKIRFNVNFFVEIVLPLHSLLVSTVFQTLCKRLCSVLPFFLRI